MTQAVLTRIERLEPTLNAFVVVDPERALAAARASETQGWPTRFGSRTSSAAGPWGEDAPGSGSIRVPSAHTGVLGLKPTFARVPASPPTFLGVPPHVGPIARSATDLALALALLSRPDVRDPWQPPLYAASYLTGDESSWRRLRIGYTWTSATQKWTSTWRARSKPRSLPCARRALAGEHIASCSTGRSTTTARSGAARVVPRDTHLTPARGVAGWLDDPPHCDRVRHRPRCCPRARGVVE